MPASHRRPDPRLCLATALTLGLLACGRSASPTPHDSAASTSEKSSVGVSDSTPSAGPSPTAAPTASATASMRGTPSTSATSTPPGGNAGTVPHSTRSGSLTLTVSGDLLWHNSTWRTAKSDGHGSYDFAPIFGSVAPIIRAADLSVCHTEVPVAPKGTSYSNYPVFAVPADVAKGVATVGFDACSTASNHSWDQGFSGVKATLDALDSAHVAHSGTARSAAEADRPVILTAHNGLKLGLVSGAYGLNGQSVPKDKSWAWSDARADHLLARAAAARRAGADVVIVAAHTGEEYQQEPTKEQIQLATRLTASPDVDMVYCHHSHVVQPWAKVNGKLVIYGLGNLVGNQPSSMPRTHEGVVGRATFDVRSGKASLSRAEYIPVYIGSPSEGPIRIHAVNAELSSGRGNRARLKETRRQVSRTVRSLGVSGVSER